MYDVCTIILQSPVYTRTPTMYLDFKLDKGAVLNQPVPEGWNGFVYVLSGAAYFGEFNRSKNQRSKGKHSLFQKPCVC